MRDKNQTSRGPERQSGRLRFALQMAACVLLALFALAVFIGGAPELGVIPMLGATALVTLHLRRLRQTKRAAATDRRAVGEPSVPTEPRKPEPKGRTAMSDEEFSRLAQELDQELRRQNKLAPKRESGSAAYAPEERDAVEQYIASAFGPVERTFYDGSGGDFRIDVAVSAPVEGEREYRTLTTVGMGARRMTVPPQLAEKNRSYAELCICLPSDWDLMNDTWPFRFLQETARRPFADGKYVDAGNVCHIDTVGDTGFAGALILPAAVRGKNRPHLMLPGGRVVNFFLLLPIREEEWRYVLERRSSFPLWRRFLERGEGLVVRPGRESCVDPETWFEEDIAPFAWTDGDGGRNELCLDAVAWRTEIWEAAGREPDGLEWEKLARAYLSRYRARSQETIRFDCSRELFCAESGNSGELRAFALDFRDFCCNDEAMKTLLKEM